MGAPAALPRQGNAPAGGDAGRRPAELRMGTSAEPPAGCPHPQPLPHRTIWKRKKPRESCWRPAGPELLLVPAPARAGLGRGRGMDSLTKGSGVAVSVLVAATASVLLL